jgi:GTP cyclohydrolase I
MTRLMVAASEVTTIALGARRITCTDRHRDGASYTRTSLVRGIFRKTAEARAEALELLPAA